MMDKKDALSLICDHCNPKIADEVSLIEAGNLIRDTIHPSNNRNPAGLVFFDGGITCVIDSGNTVMKKPSLAVRDSYNRYTEGLFIFAPREDIEGQRTSAFIKKDREYPLTVSSKKSDELEIKIETKEGVKSVLFAVEDNTKIFHLPHTYERAEGGLLRYSAEEDELLWQAVADYFKLTLKKTEPLYRTRPQVPWYFAKNGSELTLLLGTGFRAGAWFTTLDKETQHDLNLSNCEKVYVIGAQFASEKRASEWKELWKGLNIHPLSQEGKIMSKEDFELSAKKLEVQIYEPHNIQVIPYIKRILQKE